MEVEVRKKRPWLAAFLNFFLWGVGYVYAGKKKVFGAGLLLAEILEHLPILFLGIAWFTAVPGILYPLGHTIISIVLAADVYSDVKAE